MPGLLIYTPIITSRISYVFRLFFDSLIRTPYNITTDEEVFMLYDGPKLNYSGKNLSNDRLHVIPCGLLTEKDTQAQNISVSEWNHLKIFYPSDKGNLPFDIFSASFYLVSRYEEYFPHKTDEHNRFHHTDSFAYKNDFLDEPLINRWAEELKKIILIEYPAVLFSGNKYSFIPTVDVDIAYAHLGKSIFITVASYLKALLQLHIKTAIEKKLVLMHLKKDPYDTFNYQETIFGRYKLRPIYFFLAASERKGYDKNISTKSKSFKKLVKKLSLFADIGIHPSYQSKSIPTIVAEEIKNVEQNLSKKITYSRQHYLKLNLPETYRCLAEIGITDDYTMAYAGINGFRASICTPFFFYDLLAEKTLPVKIHSSSIMDGTLNDYLGLTSDDAISSARELINKVKRVNGEFIAIWHNDNLSETRQWKGWRRVFEDIINMAN